MEPDIQIRYETVQSAAPTRYLFRLGLARASYEQTYYPSLSCTFLFKPHDHLLLSHYSASEKICVYWKKKPDQLFDFVDDPAAMRYDITIISTPKPQESRAPGALFGTKTLKLYYYFKYGLKIKLKKNNLVKNTRFVF